MPPDSSFHSQTRSMNSSRPRSLLGSTFRRRAGCRRRSRWRCRRDRCPAATARRGRACAEADQHVLQREGQRVPHMQAAGHVRRRHHDRVGRLAAVRIGGKAAGPLPNRIAPRLDERERKSCPECRLLDAIERDFGSCALPPGHRSPASPTTRAISSRTSRSTMPGRCSSSQACSSGRSSPARSPRACARRRRAAARPLRRSRGSAPSWANAAAAAPEVAVDTMRSPTWAESRLDHRIGVRGCGSTRRVASAHGDALGASGVGGGAVATSGRRRYSAHGAILVDRSVSSRMSLLSVGGGSLARRCGPNASLCSGFVLGDDAADRGDDLLHRGFRWGFSVRHGST